MLGTQTCCYLKGFSFVQKGQFNFRAGGTPYDGLYGEAPPERGIFFGPQVYRRVGISLVEVYKRVVKSVIWVCERAQKGKQCSVLQKCLSSQLPMQSNWCLTPSADRARVSKGG